MIRVAVLGTGFMGRTHVAAYRTIPAVSVVAVVGRDAGRAVALAAPLGAPTFDDLDAMLAATQPDVVDCCLPTDLHRAAVEAVAARGHHVICEKPLALTVEDGRAMIAACRSAGVHLLMAQVVRFEPEYRRVAAEVRAGRIGTPVTCTLLRQGFYPGGRDRWFGDEARSGGVLVDIMIHDFDWALHQFGPAERVYARLARGTAGHRFAQGMATVRHRSGVLTLATGTWGHPGPFTVAVEIAGSEGLLRYHSDDAQPVRLLAPPIAPGADDVPLPDLSVGEDPYRTQLAHFVDVIAGRAEPLVRPEESLAALELALAARAAAATGIAQAITQEVA